jgi:ABC-type bacteriocin/lantibiotic exporter with double-glycine peptidase domain
VFLLTKRNAKRISFYSSKIPGNIYELNQGVEKYANNKLLVYLLGKIPHEYKIIENLNYKYQYLSKQAVKYSNILPAFLPFGGSIMIVIFCYVSFEYGLLDTTRLISFLYGIFRIVQISSSFSGSVSNFLKMLPNLEVFESYLEKVEKTPSFRGLILDKPEPNDNLLGLRFEKVSFSYSDDIIVFDNFRFKIHPGSFVGIIGQSGSGKSTLISLILGVKRPNYGHVSFYNHTGDIVEISNVNFGYVGPTPLLFEDTLRNNLIYGNSIQISDDKIIEMLTRLNMNSKISSLPGGLDFVFKDDTSVFSTGQLQRLCICRAMLSSSNFLILDEATSNLDTQNELSILQDLNKNRSNMTVIFISHRKTFFDYADEIYDLDSLKYCEK